MDCKQAGCQLLDIIRREAFREERAERRFDLKNAYCKWWCSFTYCLFRYMSNYEMWRREVAHEAGQVFTIFRDGALLLDFHSTHGGSRAAIRTCRHHS